MCALSILKENELLNPREGEGQVLTDERLLSSAKLAVVTTARLARRSVHHDKDWP